MATTPIRNVYESFEDMKRKQAEADLKRKIEVEYKRRLDLEIASKKTPTFSGGLMTADGAIDPGSWGSASLMVDGTTVRSATGSETVTSQPPDYILQCLSILNKFTSERKASLVEKHALDSLATYVKCLKIPQDLPIHKRSGDKDMQWKPPFRASKDLSVSWGWTVWDANNRSCYVQLLEEEAEFSAKLLNELYNLPEVTKKSKTPDPTPVKVRRLTEPEILRSVWLKDRTNAELLMLRTKSLSDMSNAEKERVQVLEHRSWLLEQPERTPLHPEEADELDALLDPIKYTSKQVHASKH